MTRTRLAATAALALLVALVPSLLAAPAGAHNDEANLALESDPVGDAGPLSIDLRISARYTGDDELVESATMTVTGTGPGATTLPETALAPVPETLGLYGAELTFPTAGAWSLQVTSTDPAGELTVEVEVPAEAASTTTDAAEDTTTTLLPTDPDGDVEDGSNTDVILTLVGLVVALGVLVLLVVLRRRGAAETTDGPEDVGSPEGA